MCETSKSEAAVLVWLCSATRSASELHLSSNSLPRTRSWLVGERHGEAAERNHPAAMGEVDVVKRGAMKRGLAGPLNRVH
jgi:hypothetical protein